PCSNEAPKRQSWIRMDASLSVDSKRALPDATAMSRTFGLLLALALLANAVSAEERPQGLLWHRSGHPATLPLQVKTDAGLDYLLHLRDVETGRIVLAAYIRGGEFFRVLTPPGLFDVMFFYGEEWRGEASMFGPETQSITLDQPLTFGASVRRKHGHLIDLRDSGEIAVREFALCQRLALDPDSLRYRLHPEDRSYARSGPRPFPPSRFAFRRYELQSRVCE
ncbi:MAG: hypothetical protein AAGF90_17080, partial [Pseudomonadota bacterium]